MFTAQYDAHVHCCIIISSNQQPSLTQCLAISKVFIKDLLLDQLPVASNWIIISLLCPCALNVHVKLSVHAGRSSSFHAGTIPANPACSGTHRSGSQAAWPCDSSSSRVALVGSRWEDPVQAVLAGSQVASGTHTGIYLRPSDIGCQYSRSIYTTCLIVWQPRHAADTSMNWQQNLFCCCTASMEQATDGAETAAINWLVLSWYENSPVSFTAQQDMDWLCDTPSVF